MNRVPLFSIIIPAFNVENTITECIESVLKQKFDACEIIAVEDGSSDSTLNRLYRLAANDNRIRIIKHEFNKGLLEARYTGLKNAEGRFVLYLDGDDYFGEGLLQTLNYELQKDATDILEFGYIKIPENINVVCNNDYSCLPSGILDNRYPHTVWNKCYSRRVVDEALASFEPFYCNMSEDEFYSFVFSFYATSYRRINDCFYCYRTGTGMSSSNRMTESAMLKSLDSIEAKTEALSDFMEDKCPEYLPLLSKARMSDLEYLVDIVLASKSSYRHRRLLLKTIDKNAGTDFEKRYRHVLSLLSAVKRRLVL